MTTDSNIYNKCKNKMCNKTSIKSRRRETKACCFKTLHYVRGGAILHPVCDSIITTDTNVNEGRVTVRSLILILKEITTILSFPPSGVASWPTSAHTSHQDNLAGPTL